MDNIKNQVEILAPGGSVEGIWASVHAGADAVYAGGTMFGARAFANNLSEEIMVDTIQQLHAHGKKLYMTVNTLLKDHELEVSLEKYLTPYYEAGLDAAIVQDMGVFQFIREYFPDLPIHVSTQMTTVSPEYACMLRQMGATRVVPARELSLSEIKEIKLQSKLEVETFVHGALCYCYSGQCLMSSMIGGRSGNRGRCAQPCRLPYELLEDGKKVSKAGHPYILSPKDICTLNLIPDMVDAGIDSFKIEGRMKKPEYASFVTSMYRKYLDLYNKVGRNGYHVDEEDKIHLMDLYNRGGFSEGYYKQHNGKQMMCTNRPNHTGTQAAKVVQIKGNQVIFEALENLEKQDVLENFAQYSKEKNYDWTLSQGVKKGERFSLNMIKQKPKINDIFYRTRNTALIESIQKNISNDLYKEKISGKLIIKENQPICLEVRYGSCSIQKFGDPAQKAQKTAITVDDVKKQMLKTGNTPYEFESLEIVMDQDLFVPMTAIKGLRRDTLDALKQQLISNGLRTKISNEMYHEIPVIDRNKNYDYENQAMHDLPQIHIFVTTQVQLDTALQYKKMHSIYVDHLFIYHCSEDKLKSYIEKAHASGIQIIGAMPYIFRNNTYVHQNEWINKLKLCDGIFVRNAESFLWVKKHLKDQLLIADQRLYVWNQRSKAFWENQGISLLTIPEELNYQELKDYNTSHMSMVVYGYLPLMISTQCLLKTHDKCKKVNKQSSDKMYQLIDRKNKKMYVRTDCEGCYNLIYNSQPLSLLTEMNQINEYHLKAIRLEFTMESDEEMIAVLDECYKVLNGEHVQSKIRDYTKGHYKRGVD